MALRIYFLEKKFEKYNVTFINWLIYNYSNIIKQNIRSIYKRIIHPLYGSKEKKIHKINNKMKFK